MMLLAVLNGIFLVALVTAEPRLTCGKTTYDPSTEKCCGSTISSIEQVIRPKCCGRRFYNKANEKCCDNSLGSIVGMTHPSCCGSEVYDMSVKRCCQDAIVFDPTVDFCLNGFSTNAVVQPLFSPISLESVEEECGKSKTYIPADKKCCRGNLHNLEPGSMLSPKCCGGSLFDSAVKICCGNTIFEVQDQIVHPKCCGASVHDLSSQICCDKVVSDISKMDLPKCCGPLAYDSATHNCVNDSLVTLVDDNEGEEINCPLGKDWQKANDEVCFRTFPADPANYQDANKNCRGFSTDQIAVRLVQVADMEAVIPLLPGGSYMYTFYRVDGQYIDGWIDIYGGRVICSAPILCKDNNLPHNAKQEYGYTMMYNPFDGIIEGNMPAATTMAYICTSPAA